MQIDEYVVQGSVAMAKGELLRIEDGRDILVYVWEGEVWLTQDRDRRDIMLKRGDWFRIERGGSTILHAFGPSTLTLTSPYGDHYAVAIDLIGRDGAGSRALYRQHVSTLADAFDLARVLALKSWSGWFARIGEWKTHSGWLAATPAA